MSKLRILHLEDSPSDAELVRRVLKKGNLDFERVLVDKKADFLTALNNFAPDIILSDHSLPSFNSHEALEIVKEANLNIPFILITANVSEEFAVDVIRKGADDYILKDRLQRLPSAIENVLDKYRYEKERQVFIDNVIENEKRFRALIENSSDGIAVLSGTGKPTYVSPSIKNILGYSYIEGKELNLVGLSHSEDLIMFQKLMQKAIANPGISFKGEPTRMTHKNGEWLWIEHVLTNMLHDPSINGIVDNFRDITDRIQFEDVMRESEEKYRSFYENSMDGILLTVPDGDILAANPAACAIFQMTEKEICHLGRLGLVDQEDPRVAMAIRKRQLTGKVATQVTFVRKDLSKFAGEVTSAVFMESAGNKRTSLIIRDISARKEAEAEALRASEEKNVILESIRDAFFAVDEHWVVTYWNKESEKLLECSRQQIIGKKLSFVFEESSNTSFFNYYRKALETNEIQNFEAFYEKTNSWFNVTAYPSANGLSVYLKDVTERKLSDLRVIELNKDLHNYTKELVIANTELEQFSYIVSHNLRAPVANIMGLATEMNDESHAPETKTMLNNALMASVNLLNNVIVDLNTILRVKKEISEKKELVSFSCVVDDIKLSIQNLIETEQVEVYTNFECNEFETLKSYIHSIFFNLISNSIKFRQAKQRPLIEICSSKNADRLIITLKDNGIGIDMSKRKDQVFGLYKRFHQHVDGKGMGLFMVKTQVETMKGKISVESIVNEGTLFTISFPI
ncbi:MAG: domain S-box protein [Pedobacter sp.]|jgi:PAS domain S-box-containing protein|nr:domain S-box protein [Pedobacter sp.]